MVQNRSGFLAGVRFGPGSGMPIDLGFLLESLPNNLPDCTWEVFCQGVGIERADMGQAFLRAFAAKVRSNGEADLPLCIRGRARQLDRDPFILWVWTLSPEFRIEPEGLPMREDPQVPENHYLLNVMREACKGAGRDWAEVAGECLEDRQQFARMQTRIAVGLGFEGAVETLPVFPD